MKELAELLKPHFDILLMIGAVGLVLCGIIYALFFKKINRLIVKYKEIILYIVFGGLTTVINIAVYGVLSYIIDDPNYILLVNVIAWAASVAFAFVVNKWFVFESKTTEKKAVGKELVAFVGARVVSLIAESLILGVFVSLLRLNEMVFKIIAQVVVLVMNYIFSKLVIFKKKG